MLTNRSTTIYYLGLFTKTFTNSKYMCRAATNTTFFFLPLNNPAIYFLDKLIHHLNYKTVEVTSSKGQRE